ncbi:MAG: DegT/DnrJ/EryC1/StrS family aminotransferase [Frankiaceae bacterium]
MSSASATTDRSPVPFFSQARSFEELWPVISAHVEEIVERGKYSHGRKVAELERAIASWTGAKHAIAVNSGTDALVLALRACGIEPGDEVAVPAYTFVASASSVMLARARPLLVDIEPDSYAMDPAALSSVAGERTRAVMPVHLFCQLADMDAIGAVAGRIGAVVVEDSAEAIGMRWNGVHAGLLGRAGVLSFFPTKTLGAVGDAGMILTNDDEVAASAGILRHHGRLGRTIDHIAGISNLSGASGTNSKMDDVQAAVLLAKLSRLDADIARRAELAAAYSERLRDVSGVVKLPTMVRRTADSAPVHYVYVIEVERRDQLVGHLGALGIGTEVYYPTPLHLQPCFAELGHRRGDFPVAEAAATRAVALPLYADLAIEQVDVVCDAIRRFYDGGAA